MGKNQPKNYLKLGILLLGVAFMAVGCLNDDLPKVSEETMQPAPGNSKIIQLLRKDIAKNPKVVAALRKLDQSQLKRSFANKTIVDKTCTN